ncbi:MAG: SpoIIE family protein phosphatase [Bacteroidia bacterium]|nr:SpoIIE family protein phosphatase [Bacteroidia bacterium]
MIYTANNIRIIKFTILLLLIVFKISVKSQNNSIYINSNGDREGFLKKYFDDGKHVSEEVFYKKNIKYKQIFYNKDGKITYNFEINSDTIKKGCIILDGAIHDELNPENEIDFLLIKILDLDTKKEITRLSTLKNKYVIILDVGKNYEVEFFVLGYLPIKILVKADNIDINKSISFPDENLLFDLPLIKSISLQTFKNNDIYFLAPLLYDKPEFVLSYDSNLEANLELTDPETIEKYKKLNESEKTQLIKNVSKRIENRSKEIINEMIHLKNAQVIFESEMKEKKEELKRQEIVTKQKQLELDLLAKDKAVSALIIKSKEAEIIKSQLIANQKRKEIEQLNQLKIINELSLKNKENEIAQKNIEAELKQKKIKGLEIEKTLSEENRKQQEYIQKMILSGLFMLVVFLFFVFINLRKTKKANKIIALQKTEVEKQKAVVDLQNHLIKEKQKEILDSIHYAKRLQEAILPPLHFINEHVPNNFVLYQPKDVVAGDFYWAEIKDDKFFIAAADSTGHGVPGAMVSVVCSNALNRTVNEFGITDTGKILDKTRELVLETFAKGNSEVKDGMDISLLCIDKSNNKVYWSGANNPLWYVKSSVTSSAVEKSTYAGLDSARPDIQLIEIKADKQPIGKSEITKPFTAHEIALQDGMQFYLFTDGFADQFGGPKGKKFMYKQLENLLISISHESMEIQKQKLENVFENWKGDLEQVDDVCVIGVKI